MSQPVCIEKGIGGHTELRAAVDCQSAGCVGGAIGGNGQAVDIHNLCGSNEAEACAGDGEGVTISPIIAGAAGGGKAGECGRCANLEAQILRETLHPERLGA